MDARVEVKWNKNARAYPDCEQCNGTGDLDLGAAQCHWCLERRIKELESALRWWTLVQTESLLEHGKRTTKVLGIEE